MLDLLSCSDKEFVSELPNAPDATEFLLMIDTAISSSARNTLEPFVPQTINELVDKGVLEKATLSSKLDFERLRKSVDAFPQIHLASHYSRLSVSSVDTSTSINHVRKILTLAYQTCKNSDADDKYAQALQWLLLETYFRTLSMLERDRTKPILGYNANELRDNLQRIDALRADQLTSSGTIINSYLDSLFDE